jgi:hypothetical protein
MGAFWHVKNPQTLHIFGTGALSEPMAQAHTSTMSVARALFWRSSAAKAQANVGRSALLRWISLLLSWFLTPRALFQNNAYGHNWFFMQ